MKLDADIYFDGSQHIRKTKKYNVVLSFRVSEKAK